MDAWPSMQLFTSIDNHARNHSLCERAFIIARTSLFSNTVFIKDPFLLNLRNDQYELGLKFNETTQSKDLDERHLNLILTILVKYSTYELQYITICVITVNIA